MTSGTANTIQAGQEYRAFRFGERVLFHWDGPPDGRRRFGTIAERRSYDPHPADHLFLRVDGGPLIARPIDWIIERAPIDAPTAWDVVAS